jgi:hypothetical protein
MSFKRMTRMISFRVSEAEFEQLKNRSLAEGARSVSDWARISLCNGAVRSDGGRQIQELNEGIQQLSGHIRRLSELIESPEQPQNGYRSVPAKEIGASDA